MKPFTLMMGLNIWPIFAVTLIYIGYCLVAADLAKDQKSPGEDLLAGPDFRVSARITVHKPGSLFMISEESVTEEFYSNKQRRALIQLIRVDEDDREQADLNSIYHYHDNQIIQNPMYIRKKCGPIAQDQLGKDLFGKLAISTEWLKERDDVPDYIIGFARLLFIVDYDRNYLLKSADVESNFKIRNQRTIMYELNMNNTRDNLLGPGVVLKIYYAETGQHSGGFDMPMRIHYKDKDFGYVVIDYSLIGPLEEDIIEEEGDILYPLDLFALPIGIGCSEKMTTVSESGWQVVPVQVASFNAEIFKHNRLGTEQTSLSRRFIAFDDFAGAMRSDSINSMSYSTSIIDFWNMKKYNILSENVAVDKKVSKKPCVASSVADPEQYKTFLPFRELVYMGKATIRGVQCFAFEHTTTLLPPVIFPPMTYTNLDGKEESIFGLDPQTFSVVYYFAINSDEQQNQRIATHPDVPSSPLMRIDVYNKQTLVYHMDIFDYINRLVDAPNGDREEELFALKDRCSSGQLGSNGYANLAMELTYKPAGSTTQETVFTCGKKATLRALARGSEGIITKISDIETQLRLTSSGDLKLYVEARLNLPDVEMSQVRQIGWSAMTRVAETEVKTIEECFQWAAHAQSSESNAILFISCANSCSIDLNPRVEYEKKDGKTIESITSSIYVPEGKRSPSTRTCPAMLVERVSSTGAKNKQSVESRLAALRVSYNYMRTDLDGKVLRLSMPHNQEMYNNNTVDDLTFVVSKVDINNDKWSVALGYEKAHMGDDDDNDDTGVDNLFKKGYAAAIDGVGLTRNSGQIQSARQKDSSIDEELVMNYQICHSICMADMSCKSFSVCITRQEVECIISEVDLRDRALMKQIESNLNQEKQQSANNESRKISRTITIEKIKRKKTEDGQGSYTEKEEQDEITDQDNPLANYERLELKVDFRCRLYKKQALDMFHKLRSATVVLKNSNLLPVDSQEECAEICMGRNLNFFKHIAQTKLELHQNNQDELDDEDLVKRMRDKYNNNLKNWCATFHYLSLSSPDLNEQAHSYIDPEKLKKAGLCVMARSLDLAKKKVSPKKNKKKDKLSTSTSSSSSEVTVASSSSSSSSSDSEESKVIEKVGPRVSFESFQFLYSNLFDIQYGLRLEEAKKDDQGKPLPMINKSRSEYAPDAESCARRCFLQTTGLNPWCKSFDFIETRSTNVKNKLSSTVVNRYCEFHTLSLAEIRLNGMVEFMVTDLTEIINKTDGLIVQSWHYDSRESYTLEDAVLSELILVKSEATLFENIQAYRLHSFGILTILLASMILAAAIIVFQGDNIANRFPQFCSPRRDSISDPPRSFLSSLVPGTSQQGGSVGPVSSSFRHKRFVADDQDLPEIPELNPI